MSANEILIAIKQLPVEEQKKVLDSLSQTLAEEHLTEAQVTMSEDDFEQLLLAKGIITEIPVGFDDDEDDFEPIEVKGKPLSETIIEERR